MGEFRDMGNPAQVVKKIPAQAAKPRVQDFFYHACRISHVPIFAHTGNIFLYESLHNKHFFGLFFNFACFFLSNRCQQRVATQIPICLHIMLRDLLTQKSVNQRMVTIFGYPRACRFRKYQFENRSWELPLPTFFKT
jgi:hypothetical protein